jgi:hypothetical protein
MRHLWHLFNALMLLHIVLAFTADTTLRTVLHAASATGFALAVLLTRPKVPPTLRR